MAAIAERDLRLEREPAEQFSSELRLRSGFPNDKRSRSAYIDNTIVPQFSGEDARTKRPVSANVDASQENDQSHPVTGSPRSTNRPSYIIVSVACTLASSLRSGPC
jgi:hypothetical protein